VELKSTLLESGTIPDVTATVDTATPGFVHPRLAYRLYVTVPPALKLLVRVAESDTPVPTMGAVEAKVVEIVGLALLTVKGSQGLITPLLLESPV